jgi:F-type H+-transporting ATPase subunit gamma
MQGRDMLEFLDGLLQRSLAAAEAAAARSKQKTSLTAAHPLCRADKDGPTLLVLFTSDTGLCGAYNTNLISMTEAYLRQDGRRPNQMVYIGKKGYRYFTKRGFAATDSYLDLAGRPNIAKAETIGKAIMERFLSGQVASVQLLYAQYLSSMSSKPTVLQWLPIKLDAAERDAKKAPQPVKAAAADEYIFEPSPKAVFEDLLPRWVVAKFQLVMLEAFTSEHSARMIAMKNATDNAEELLKTLTRQRNKIRQASITKEISEIVGTAEALK